MFFLFQSGNIVKYFSPIRKVEDSKHQCDTLFDEMENEADLLNICTQDFLTQNNNEPKKLSETQPTVTDYNELFDDGEDELLANLVF